MILSGVYSATLPPMRPQSAISCGPPSAWSSSGDAGPAGARIGDTPAAARQPVHYKVEHHVGRDDGVAAVRIRLGRKRVLHQLVELFFLLLEGELRQIDHDRVVRSARCR